MPWKLVPSLITYFYHTTSLLGNWFSWKEKKKQRTCILALFCQDKPEERLKYCPNCHLECHICKTDMPRLELHLQTSMASFHTASLVCPQYQATASMMFLVKKGKEEGLASSKMKCKTAVALIMPRPVDLSMHRTADSNITV